MTTDSGGNDSQRTGQVSARCIYFNHRWDPRSNGGSETCWAHSPRPSLPAASNAALPCTLPAVEEEGEDGRKEGLPQPLRGVLPSTQKSAPQFPLSLSPGGRGRANALSVQ